ncbi:NgoFVII family restriction endonuclease [Flavobacterium piscinae]|uniref:NgoFVII family restriction endonuclease n=1 Tax=Flavobacterium piscinae TaxID=2506424 RepID=A0A4Q1KWK2_9FLAO|nr:phospholipase D-like domain-containing protein [Flavobacterium piscinae]RXR34653.1 NgoFVII family restriction endonuclease [Flavobacterium piscinae]
MKIIKSPWKNELMQMVSDAKESIKITSPFVKENICAELLQHKKSNSSLELITSFKLMNIYNGSVDLNGLEHIIKSKGVVKNFSRLHAKIYLFDDKKAVVTSGNLTNGGLLQNYEYGFYIDEPSIVSEISNDFNQLLRDETMGQIELNHIKEVRSLLKKIPKSEQIPLPTYSVDATVEKNDVITLPEGIISSTLKGWKLIVFNCIQSIPKDVFTLNDVNAFVPQLQKDYPNNNTIPAKIRQQLQLLRDLGLIEFLGNGNYKKLWQ